MASGLLAAGRVIGERRKDSRSNHCLHLSLRVQNVRIVHTYVRCLRTTVHVLS
jgi:hypothetical protein